MKKPPNLVETKKENQLFQINEKLKNSAQQRRKNRSRKPILDFISNI